MKFSIKLMFIMILVVAGIGCSSMSSHKCDGKCCKSDHSQCKDSCPYKKSEGKTCPYMNKHKGGGSSCGGSCGK